MEEFSFGILWTPIIWGLHVIEMIKIITLDICLSKYNSMKWSQYPFYFIAKETAEFQRDGITSPTIKQQSLGPNSTGLETQEARGS